MNQESAILDYLNKSTTNDVTIVYEITGGNMKSILEHGHTILVDGERGPSGVASLTHEREGRTIIDWTDDNGDGIMQAGEVDDTYYLVPNSKVIGLGMGVNQERP